jgi:hypothetical protein
VGLEVQGAADPITIVDARCHQHPAAQHVRLDSVEAGVLADRSNPSVGGSTVEPVTVAAKQDRSSAAVADRDADSACGSRHERHG